MRTTRLTLALLVILAAALFAISGAAGSATGTKTKQASGPIRVLAMDGSRVAYGIANPRGRGHFGSKVLVWNTRTGKVTRVSGKRTYAAETTSTGYGVRELAISGTRIAWIINQGGNTESDDYLCASSVARPAEHLIAGATRGDPGPYAPGDWIGGLAGSDGLLGVNRWSRDQQGSVTDARLVLIGTWGLKRIAVGETTMLAQSADAGRIAVLRSDGTVALYARSGKLLLQVMPSSASNIALHGKYLVVMTKARKLEVYDSHMGSLLKTLPVRGRVKAIPQNLDVEANLAVYTVWPDVRVANLETGKDTVIGHMRAFYLYEGVFAQIEPAGVVYAGNVRNRPAEGLETGTLVFVPFAKVAGAVK